MPKITEKQVANFNDAFPQLKTLLETIKELAKKKPDGALNKFKIARLNEVLDVVNDILGDTHRPFKTFEKFDTDADFTTASDATLVLSQYLDRMQKFKADHSIMVDDLTMPGFGHKVSKWNTGQDQTHKATTKRIKK